MSLWKGGEAVESGSGSKVKAGAYKFKIEEAKHYPNNYSVGFRMALWDGDNKKVTEKFWDFFSIDTGAKDAIKQETDRKIKILLGKTDLNSESELVGKTGYVIVRDGANNGEAIPFGGYYDNNKKSVTGQESMSDRLKEALDYNWKDDHYAVDRYNRSQSTGSSSTPETDDDMPF